MPTERESDEEAKNVSTESKLNPIPDRPPTDVPTPGTGADANRQIESVTPIQVDSPPKRSNKVVRTVTTVSASYHEGPLPSAEVIAQYESILPGAADRIFKMAERQQSHRHGMEKNVLASHIRRSREGLFAGLAVAVGGLVLAGISLYLGYPWTAFALTSGTLASLVGVFVVGKKAQDDELADKRRNRGETAGKSPPPMGHPSDEQISLPPKDGPTA